MKKILVISHSCFSMFNGNGKTLHSIFSGWENNYLKQIFFQNEIPSSNVFRCLFRITDLDMVKLVFSSRKNLSHFKCTSYLNHEESQKPNVGMKAKSFIRRLHFLKFFFREVLYSTFLLRKTNILEELKEYKPEVVFFMGSFYSFGFNLARNISNEINAKLYVYITDDYLFSFEEKKIKLIDVKRFFLKKAVSRALNTADKAFVISEDMKLVYEENFKREFELLNNCVDVKEYEPYEINGDFLDIVFAGGLSVGRYEALLDFMAVLSLTKLKMPYRVSIYSNSYISNGSRNELLKSGVEIFNPMYGRALENRLRQAHLLLHVESVMPKFKKQTRFSISTKLTEYLSYGRCILAYGPGDISSIGLIAKNDVGLALDANRDKSQLIDDLQRNLNDIGSLINWSFKAHAFARNNYDLNNPAVNFLNRINNGN